jgi:hypothetical protein
MKHPGHTYGGFVPAISEWGMTTSYSYLMDVEFTLASILEDKDLKGEVLSAQDQSRTSSELDGGDERYHFRIDADDYFLYCWFSDNGYAFVCMSVPMCCLVTT